MAVAEEDVVSFLVTANLPRNDPILTILSCTLSGSALNKSGLITVWYIILSQSTTLFKNSVSYQSKSLSHAPGNSYSISGSGAYGFF